MSLLQTARFTFEGQHMDALRGAQRGGHRMGRRGMAKWLGRVQRARVWVCGLPAGHRTFAAWVRRRRSRSDRSAYGYGRRGGRQGSFGYGGFHQGGGSRGFYDQWGFDFSEMPETFRDKYEGYGFEYEFDDADIYW